MELVYLIFLGLLVGMVVGQNPRLRTYLQDTTTDDETGGPTNFQLPSRRVFPNQATGFQTPSGLQSRQSMGSFSDYDDNLYRRPYYSNNPYRGGSFNNGFKDPNFDYEDYTSVYGVTPSTSNYPFAGFGNQGFPNNGFNQGMYNPTWSQGTPSSMWGQGSFSPTWNQWSSNSNPSLGFSNMYPNQGFSSMYPNQGFSSTYPNQGFSSTYPNQGFSSTYPNQGFSSTYPNQGFSNMYPNQGFSSQGYPGGFSNQGFINQRYPGQGFSGAFASSPQLGFGNVAPAGFGNFASPPFNQGAWQYPNSVGRSWNLNDYDDFDNNLTPVSNPSRRLFSQRSDKDLSFPGSFGRAGASSRAIDNESNLNSRARSSRAFDDKTTGDKNSRNSRSEKETNAKPIKADNENKKIVEGKSA